MAVKIADIYAALGLDPTAYNRGLSAAQGKASAFSQSVTGFLEQAGRRAFDALIRGTEMLISAMGNAVQASSNLNESINKVGVVFGAGAQEILKWSETSTTALGLSQQKAIDAAGSFGALFVQMGQGTEKAAAFSENLVQIATDLASVYNTSTQQALEALQSGLVGMSRPLRQFNIFLTEESVAQKAVQLGLAATTASLSEQDKAMARYALIVEQSALTQGDFANTSKNLANAQKILGAEIEQGSTKLGNVFRPAIEAITNSLVGFAPRMFDYATNIMDQFANGIADGIRAIIPAITLIGQVFAYWLKPGSPPRFLPDIAKWGAAAMGQFLSGFSSVDVKGAFDTVGRAIETILRSEVSAGKANESGLVSAVFGTRAAIQGAVAEFARAGSVSESTINKIVRSAGVAGPSIGALVKAYFNLQTATTAATRAQDSLNRITEKYDEILNPLRGKLDEVRAQQQRLADQQRLISAQNVLNNFESTAAEKKAASLEIQQIALEEQIATTEQQKKVETDKAQAQLDGAKKQEDAAQKQLDIAQATIDQQVETNNLIGEQIRLEERLADERKAAADKAEAEAKKQQQLAEQLHQAQLQYQLGIANTQGKLAILRGELANTTAGTAEYFNILGEIASLEKQAAEEAKRDADKVTDAQLNYNLSLADTAGKIAIWQGELAKATPGSAEYFQILTKIHDLTVQYNKELDKLGGTDIGAGLTTGVKVPILEVTKAGQNLADAVTAATKAVEKLFGIKPPPIIGPTLDTSWDSSIKQLTGDTGGPAVGEPPAWLKIIIDTIKDKLLPLFDGVGEKLGTLTKTLETTFSEKFQENIQSLADSLGSIASIISVMSTTIGPFFEGFTKGFSSVDAVSTNVSGTLHGIAGLFQENKETITHIVSALGETIGLIWRTTLNELVAVLRAIGGLIGLIWSSLLTLIEGDFSVFSSSFRSNWDNFWTNGVLALFTNIIGLATGIWKVLLEFLPQSFTTFSTNFGASWSTFWSGIATGLGTHLTNAGKTFGKFFTDAGTSISTGFTNIAKAFYDGGVNFIKRLGDGIKDSLPSLPGWMQKGLDKLVDQLPGSEPKDPSSPLAGLGKRGAALVENFKAGMNAASLSVQPLANSLLPAGAGTTNNTSSYGPIAVNITINGNASEADVRKGANDGVLSALRAAGIR